MTNLRKVVLTVGGKQVIFSPTGHKPFQTYVGLMFYPWLEKEHTNGNHGPWTLMSNHATKRDNWQAKWQSAGPWFDSYEEALSAMNQYNDMVRNQCFIHPTDDSDSV